MSEASLREEVDKTLQLYERLTGRPASRTWPMFDDNDYVGTLSRLVMCNELQKGFKVLRDSKRLGATFEAIIGRHKDIFTPEVVQAAQWRLDNPYDLLPRSPKTPTRR